MFAMLIQKGRPDRYPRVLEIAEIAYKPMLKALSYTLDEVENRITLYSHAAIDLACVEALAVRLEVPYADETARELASTIDAINGAFAVYVRKKTVHHLYADVW